jgi:hypothetical protein
MADFNLTKMAVNMYCPGNVVQQDDAGLPSLLVWIPAFKLSDVLNCDDDSTHPAFIVNGKEIPGFYYSKYQNIVHNGKAYSLPGENPQTGITYDNARARCEEKGYGWHMSTAAEWAAIALWCKKNGSLPYGNNNYGKDSRETEQKAIPVAYDGEKISRISTGTGPLTWSHDGTASGIWDLNGNIYEWIGGLRLVWGELQILVNNDASDSDNPQNATSTCWKAIKAADGSLVDPECKTTDTAVKTSGNTVKLDYVNGAWTYSTGISNASDSTRWCAFANIVCTDAIGEAANVLLRALALLPDDVDSNYELDNVYWNNTSAECCVYRGGSYYDGAASGLFNISGSYPRTRSTGTVGFRSAYIPNI